MDARTPVEEKRFLPAVANAIDGWFPEAGGRVVAVSDVSITRENIPELPLVLVAFKQSIGSQLEESHSELFKIVDTFLVEFWMKPERIKAGGKETPYWSYYPYEYVRNKLINGFLDFEGPNGEHVAYRGLQVMTSPLAAHLSFTFLATYRWCTGDKQVVHDCYIEGVDFRMCTPQSCIPDPECPEQQGVDPCHPCP
jgi:hypothetical protein